MDTQEPNTVAAKLATDEKPAPTKKRGPYKKRPVKASASKEKRKRISRNFPAASFEEAVDFAKAIFKLGSGNPVRRLTLFNELGKSPESSASRLMITHAGRYGLIKGSYKAEQLELTPDGLRAIDEDPDITEDRRRLENFRRSPEAIPLRDVKAWVESWGTDHELPLPKPRRALYGVGAKKSLKKKFGSPG